MNSGIKIIKRIRTDELKNAPLRQDEKTGRQSEREIVGTVKNWIAELAQRKRADEHRAAQIFAAIHCRALTQQAAQ
jgi:hypothetical protein